MPKLLAALCFELPTLEGGEAAVPTEITLIPAPGADGFVRGVDGRAWRMSKPANVVAAFNRPRAITENHAGKLAAPKGGSAPAFGWIASVREQAGAIVASVSWTERGKRALSARDYRYFSPEFVWEEKTIEILAIAGGGLLNDPNFEQLALNSSEQETEHPPMSLIAICRALGIPEAGDEAACITAIDKLKVERQTALNQAQFPDRAKFVPVEEHNVALNAKQAAETELQTLKTGQRETEITATVDQALAAGKIVPATKDYYLAMCRAEGGLEQFKKFVEAQPVIGEPTHTGKKPEGAGTGAHGLTESQLAICSSMGMDPKTYAEELKALKA